MDYRYLVTTKNATEPFLTHWFDPENNFNVELGMIVYDLQENKFTIDGAKWIKIQRDHL